MLERVAAAAVEPVDDPDLSAIARGGAGAAHDRSRETDAPEIAYILKAYPRASEPFILSEVHRLEAAGLRLRLFAAKPAEANDREPRHPVIDRILAEPEYLTRAAFAGNPSIGSWLRTNWPQFAGAVRRVARRHPLGLARGLARLAAEVWHSRTGPVRRMRTAYVREFLQAVEIVDRLADTPSVRHLHAHFAHGATTLAWFASTVAGLSFSFTGHAKDLYRVDLNPGGALRRKLVAARFALTCTDTNRQLLEALGTHTPVYCLYHGINADFSRLLAASRPPSRADGPCRILAVGRLVRKKGFDVLLDAVTLLRSAGVPVDVQIIGSDGDHADELRLRVRRLGLHDVVTMRGAQDQRTLFEEYHRAHVFCLPCRVLEDGDRDGIPNVLMEAMACATPVVTTDVSGIPELVRHRENGFVVPAEDSGALARAIFELASDERLRARIGGAARDTIARHFDGDRLVERLAGLFREVVR